MLIIDDRIDFQIVVHEIRWDSIDHKINVTIIKLSKFEDVRIDVVPVV